MSEHFQYLKEGLVADPETCLYKEGPAYLYSFLKEEIERDNCSFS